jgi:8-oxo-dGTP pyrophosphatase MutT (NUDIX family)
MKQPRQGQRAPLDAEMAAGGLVWDKRESTPRLAVIHRPKHDDWSLPKGKQQPREPLLETARREVAEELGCQFRVDTFGGVACYMKGGRPKVVLYWNMTRLDDERFRPNAEVDQMEWLPPEEALARLTHATERDLVRQSLQSPG